MMIDRREIVTGKTAGGALLLVRKKRWRVHAGPLGPETLSFSSSVFC